MNDVATIWQDEIAVPIALAHAQTDHARNGRYDRARTRFRMAIGVAAMVADI